MNRLLGKINLILIFVLLTACLAACGNKETGSLPNPISENESEDAKETESDEAGISIEISEEEPVIEEPAIEEPVGEEDGQGEEEAEQSEEFPEEASEKIVDLIMFMGQSNMSGCGGNAALAPYVSEEAGYEFRAISDPTCLYQIKEPFGINENNINGIMERPGGKKGSLVSAFVNEYYSLTGVPVIAVSAALGETDMDKWLSPNMSGDVLGRFVTSKNWLNDNGYTIRHMYVVWLQGESDGLKRLSKDGYKTKMDDFIRPLFIEGMEKVFIITPGRTIDSTVIYSEIIAAQIEMSRDSSYYGLATSVLAGVSTEYMTDIYHYNQHVLNMVGEEAAKSVAYYSNNGREMILYDYKNNDWFIPNGNEDDFANANGPIDLSSINEQY